MNILIIGAGELGTVIGGLISEKQVAVTFWDSDPEKRNDGSLEILARAADAVFFCLPSWTFREALESVLPFLKTESYLVSFSKGIEEKSLKTIPEIFKELAPQFSFAVLGGPMLAEEIKMGKVAVGVVASERMDLCENLRVLFSSDRFSVELSNDPVSVSLSGVLKNIYAVSLGIADGLKFSGNQKGWLVSRAIDEMRKIARILKVDETVLLGAAGLGDLVATGFSEYSRNRTVGEEIVRSGVCSFRGEGLSSLPPLMKKLGDKVSELPLLSAIYQAGVECRPAAPIFSAFFYEEKK